MRPLNIILALFLLQVSLASCTDMKKAMGIRETILDIPGGDYIGSAKRVELSEGADISKFPEQDKVKVTFLPKDQDLTDGVGVLQFHDSSQRFYWRSDGNSQDTWNVLFYKDNNIYSSFKNTFKFDGVVNASEIENKIEGRLYFDYAGSQAQYFITAFQLFNPELIKPKATIEIKAGEQFSVEALKIGAKQEELSVFIESLSEGSARAQELKIISVEDSKNGREILLKTSEKLEKGEYIIYLLRSESYKSNSIPLNIV